ncbi:response regulator [Geotalea toluenoxydans]|uniref:response regulator n=1 Tax=Geotalea toluenoxydans TaxID=421624 RepID=UPI0006CF322F|nr:response regulator [Geotalea toluenoxydans]
MDETVRILCVDDERNVLRAIERMFIDEDYEIITASSGEEGLEKLSSSENVHVIISDYRMPGMNGVEFLKKACSLRPETIRIVLSGYADTAAVVAAINEGEIYRFIPKPWNEDELRMTIAKAVEMFALHRENAKLSEELHAKSLALEHLSGAVDQQQVSVPPRP